VALRFETNKCFSFFAASAPLREMLLLVPEFLHSFFGLGFVISALWGLIHGPLELNLRPFGLRILAGFSATSKHLDVFYQTVEVPLACEP
jgi:hypothetical protein